VFEAGGEQAPDARPERHKTVLAELAAAHLDELPLDINAKIV
jgi:hypothetical protein